MMMNNEPLREKYRRYLDIISFLSNINVPLMKDLSSASSSSPLSYNVNNHVFGSSTDIDWVKIHQQPELLTFPSQVGVYKNLSGVYLTRIPTWTLLKEPWALLDPLMSTYPDIAAKLYSLWRPLYLDKDVFLVRQLMAKYTSMRNSPSTSLPSSSSLLDEKTATIPAGSYDNSPYGMLSSSLDTIMDDQTKIDLLKWVIERESKESDGHSTIALSALEDAISIINANAVTTTSGVGNSNFDVIKDEMLTEIVRLNSLRLLREFQSKFDMTFPNDLLLSKDNPLLSTPVELCLKVLDTCSQVAWINQLDALKITGRTVLCTNDLLGLNISASTIVFVQNVGKVLQSLSLHALKNPTHANSSTRELLLNIRQSYFNKLLYSSCDDSDDNDNEWALHASKPVQYPTTAEVRRRNDVYRAFCLALLAHTCCTSDEMDLKARGAYITQLDAFATGAKTNQKITARGRFRCAQAVFYLRSIHQLKTQTSLRHYLLCLGEVKESRMICSEETLATALGHAFACDQSSVVSTPDPSMLIRTWIRDEGHHTNVMELCRDLLVSAGHISNTYAASSTCLQLWAELLHHMCQRGQVVTLIHSLVIIRDTAILRSLFTPHPRLSIYNNQTTKSDTDNQYIFGFELLSALIGAAGDVLEKTTLLLEYIQRHTHTSSVHTSTVSSGSKGDDTNDSSVKGNKSTCEKDLFRVLLMYRKQNVNTHSPSLLTWGESAPEDGLMYMKRICVIWECALSLKPPGYNSKLVDDACNHMSKVVIKWLRQAQAFMDAAHTADISLVGLAKKIGEVCEESATMCMTMDVAKNWSINDQPYINKIKELSADYNEKHDICNSASFMYECLYQLAREGTNCSSKQDSNDVDVQNKRNKDFIWRVCTNAFTCSQTSLSIALHCVTSESKSSTLLETLLHMTCLQWWSDIKTGRLFSMFILKYCGQLLGQESSLCEAESIFSCLTVDEKRSLLLLLDEKVADLSLQDKGYDKVENDIFENVRSSLANPF